MTPTPDEKPASRLRASLLLLRQWIVSAASRLANFVLRLGGRARQTGGEVSRAPFGQVVRKFLLWTAAIVGGLAILLLAAALYYPTSVVPDYIPVSETYYLPSQGWGASRESPDRQTYYYTPQGANLKGLPYEWFVHLERPGSKQRLADPDHMRRYRFLVDTAPSPKNPHQLPVGFTKYFDPEVGQNVVDVTCAVCHTGQLHVEKDGKRFALRIDGGQAMHAFTAAQPGHFVPELLSSLLETYLNPFKFRRFAMKVLGDRYPSGVWKLHGEIRRQMVAFWPLLRQGLKGLYPVTEGFGRTDALSRICNTVFGDHVDTKNYRVGNAPVSFPPVWDIWKFDWVQYAASVRQPMARNLGETLGTGAKYRLIDPQGNPIPEQERFATSTMFTNLVTIENTLKALKAPKWPENFLGPIDCSLAAQGQALFQSHCQSCHGPHNDENLKAWQAPLKKPDEPHWRIVTKPVEVIGTDPAQIDLWINNRYDLSKTGITADQVRRLLLPQLAIDEKGRIEYLKKEIKELTEKLPRLKDTDRCWALSELAGMQADLGDPSECERVLLGLDQARQARDSACRNQQVPILTFMDAACVGAIATYKKTVMEIAEKAASVCPNIGGVVDQIDIRSVTMGTGLNYIGILMREKYYRDNAYADLLQQEFNGYGMLDLPQVIAAYKARPLAGVWATAPYLHNGSVPNLSELLSPGAQRSTRFPIGHRTFDPVNVGVVTRPHESDKVFFDTSIKGNWNTGHEFRAGYVEPCQIVKDGAGNERALVQHQPGVIGPELKPSERRAIIEYLKIHEDGSQGDCELPERCRAELKLSCPPPSRPAVQPARNP